MVSRAEKYESKAFVDTVVFRGSDVAAANVCDALGRFSVSAAALAILPLAGAWMALGGGWGGSKPRDPNWPTGRGSERPSHRRGGSRRHRAYVVEDRLGAKCADQSLVKTPLIAPSDDSLSGDDRLTGIVVRFFASRDQPGDSGAARMVGAQDLAQDDSQRHKRE